MSSSTVTGQGLSEGQQLRELVSYISRALVDKPEEVSVNLLEGESAIVLELRVDPEDIGKVIGKGGQTAKSLRKLLSAAATKLRKKAMLQIVE